MAVTANLSAGQVLTASTVNTYMINSGLVYVTSVSVPASPASSTIVVSNAFNSTYNQYKIIVGGLTCSVASNAWYMTLNGSTGSTYSSIVNWLDYATGALSGTRNNNSNAGFLLSLTGDASDTNLAMDIYNPYLATRTTMTAQSANGAYNTFAGGRDSNTASSTGFTLIAPAGNTFVNGTVTVYGYRKA